MVVSQPYQPSLPLLRFYTKHTFFLVGDNLILYIRMLHISANCSFCCCKLSPAWYNRPSPSLTTNFSLSVILAVTHVEPSGNSAKFCICLYDTISSLVISRLVVELSKRYTLCQVIFCRRCLMAFSSMSLTKVELQWTTTFLCGVRPHPVIFRTANGV